MTELSGSGPTAPEALANLLEDRYAMLIKGGVYLRPVSPNTIEVLQMSEEDRPIISWEAKTTVIVMGDLEEDH